jgi:hypothetical protein
MAMIKGRCEPARNIIDRLGGVTATAKIINKTPSAVSRWLVPRSEGGTNGRVPQNHWETILDFAVAHKIALTLNDLLG